MKTLGGTVYQALKLNKLFESYLLKLCFYLAVALFSSFSVRAKENKSVQFIFSSEKTIKDILLFPGRVSLLKLPCLITKALVGSPNDIKAEIDKLQPTEAHLLLKKWQSQPSNLILKCSNKVFLFNLVPSKISHYDYVKVLSHISEKPLTVKFPFPNTPSPLNGGLRKGENFTIRKILDFSLNKEKSR